MIFGTDTGDDQPTGTYDRGAFEIVNLEDWEFAVKVRACVDARIPWGAYLWIYPEKDMAAMTVWAVEFIRALGHGDPVLGLWFDYEQAGIVPDQLQTCFAVADGRGMRSGYYAGPTALDHAPFEDRRWWNAAYPDPNDGAYPGVAALFASSTPRDMTLWQYSSTGGSLDRNVVIDEDWYRGLADVVSPSGLEDDVIYKETGEGGTVSYWEPCFDDYVKLPDRVGEGAELNGVHVIPIETKERIAMGVARRALVRESLQKLGLIT